MPSQPSEDGHVEKGLIPGLPGGFSRGPGPMNKRLIPKEIVDRFCFYLGPKDASKVRLAHRNWTQSASESLYSTLVVTPSDKSAAHLESVGKSKYAKAVRKIDVNTWLSRVTLSDGMLQNAFEQVAERMTGLKDIVIRFMSTDHSQGVEFRQGLMHTLIFGIFMEDERTRLAEWDLQERTRRLSLMKNEGKTSAEADQESSTAPPVISRLKALSIENLQDVHDDLLVTSPEFKAVLQGLKTLRLGIMCAPQQENSPVNPVYGRAYFFLEALPIFWMNPSLTPCLTSLTLYFPRVTTFHRVGPIEPLIYLGDLHFPNLKTLCLGNYGLWHKDQLNWIFDHKNTLEELSFDICPILYLFYCTSEERKMENLDGRDDVEHAIATDVIYPYHAYPYHYTKVAHGVYSTRVRWADYLQKIDENLGKLKKFWFNSVPYGGPHAILDETVRLREWPLPLIWGRYRAYNREGCSGESIASKISGKDGIEYHPNFNASQDGEDQDTKDEKALRKILRKTKQIDENDAAQMDEYWENIKLERESWKENTC
ncbi:hypothetical protein BU16DRAFT_598877 [Lophium mytilinum]|uniref:F-box domain-containing protein n=1 Tax=Lophium mytilinum TaxID=390894 RepID=A0A6A6R938_9PEZI|nr:hypothetical protein BU16DRAFT_598877 [Lophium mytilinum]